jgi:Lysylphosphatidylglycerol synthase TM region
VSSESSQRTSALRVLAAILGIGLLAYLVCRIGPAALLKQTLAVGWGMLLILFLGGVSHLVKACAWRLTIPNHVRSVSVPRAFALRLISEAVGQFGLAGQVVGEGMRVSLIGSSVPVAIGISSATIDRGLYTLSAAVVGIGGLVGAVMLFPLSSTWKIYSLVFAATLLVFVLLTVLAVVRQWPVLSAVVRGLQRIPALGTRLNGKEQTILSAEQTLLSFHREAPIEFWTTIVLNLFSQILAITEVYLLLLFMGSRIGFVSAFVFEAFTKLVNVVGALVPGNIGTYEGGSMLIGRFFKVTSTAGLAVAVCRRARGLFWAVIGMICLTFLSRSDKARDIAYMSV